MNSIADMLTRIRNGQLAHKASVRCPKTNLCLKILDIMCDEGFIRGYSRINDKEIMILLKYLGGKAVIRQLGVISCSSRRLYLSTLDLYRLSPQLGLLILSTPKGIMQSDEALKLSQGGELLCYIE
ncbi:unnamed protein product [Discosporangium mesarthrocarpum]